MVPELFLGVPRTKNPPLIPDGKLRWTQDRSTFIKVLGCYGYGSGGHLYNVTLPNNEDIRAPFGLSNEDIDTKYPLNTNGTTRFERL